MGILVAIEAILPISLKSVLITNDYAFIFNNYATKLPAFKIHSKPGCFYHYEIIK